MSLAHDFVDTKPIWIVSSRYSHFLNQCRCTTCRGITIWDWVRIGCLARMQSNAMRKSKFKICVPGRITNIVMQLHTTERTR